jgi:hypothetical protein
MAVDCAGNVLAEGHKHTMALDQSALLEVLEALKTVTGCGRCRVRRGNLELRIPKLRARITWSSPEATPGARL